MPANFQTFQFTADTIDGKILEFPKIFDLQCACVKPLGTDIIKQFNKTECIVAKKVFLIYCDGQVFGSTQFTNVGQFIQYLNNACQPQLHCTLFLGGCQILFNGCFVLT